MRHEQMKQNKTKQGKINKPNRAQTSKWSCQSPHPKPLISNRCQTIPPSSERSPISISIGHLALKSTFLVKIWG